MTTNTAQVLLLPTLIRMFQLKMLTMYDRVWKLKEVKAKARSAPNFYISFYCIVTTKMKLEANTKHALHT